VHTATLRIGQTTLEVSEADSVTFGRSDRCTVRLSPIDEGVSRWAGSLACESGTWWITNESETRPFEVVDEMGFSHPIGPGLRYAVAGGRVEVVIAGLVHRYCLAVAVTPPDRPAGDRPLPSGRPTVNAPEALVTHRERLALAALLVGYLEPFPRTTNRPSTYQEAAHRIGTSPSTVRKRIEHLRRKLTQAGVPNLWGPQATEHLAAHAIATRLVTPEDLSLLPRR
jgi:hypothetical protein